MTHKYYLAHREILLEKQKRYYLKHKKKINDYNKQYYKDHLQETLQYLEKWRLNNPHKSKEYSQKFRLLHPDKVHLYEQRRYSKNKGKRLESNRLLYQKNKEKILTRQKQYRKTHPDKYLECKKKWDYNKKCKENERRIKLGLPKIGEGYKTENFIYNVIKNEYPDLKIKRNDRKILNGLELDMFMPQFNIGIEYMGIQHFKKIDFFQKNTNSTFEVVQQRDKIKRIICKEKDIKLIEFFYYEKLTSNYILDKLKEFGFDMKILSQKLLVGVANV